VTLTGPSTRGVSRPIAYVVGISSVADIFTPSINHAVALWRTCVRQLYAHFILNPFSRWGLASRKAASAALRKLVWSTASPTSAASASGDRHRLAPHPPTLSLARYTFPATTVTTPAADARANS